MTRGKDGTYYVAVALSAVSSLGWLAVPVLGLYTLYLALTGGSAAIFAIATLGALGTGVSFALLERRFLPDEYRD